MTGDGVICHAVLVYHGARCFDAEAMRRDIETAYRATGEWTETRQTDDPQAVPGRSVCARFDVFAPIEEGGTVPVGDYEEGIEVFAAAYPDLPAPSALISVQVFAQDAATPQGPRLSAVLGQIVDLFVDRTEADLVRLPETAGLMTGARFRSELCLATGGLPGTLRWDEAGPQQPGAAASGSRPRQSPEAFCDIDSLEARLERDWKSCAGWSDTSTRSHETAQGTALVPVEARLATWAVNASVAIFAPPVGASLAVYNLLRGEDFRLNAHALALTGTFLALGASAPPFPGLGGLL